MSRLLLVAFQSSELAQGAGFARAVGLPYDILLLTGSLDGAYGSEKQLAAGIASVPPADAVAPAIAALAAGYTHVAAISSMGSKDVMARVAGLLDAGMVTDVSAVESPTVFKRPVVAGSMIATVEVLSSPVVLTVRPAGFTKEPAGSAASPQATSIPEQAKARRVAASHRSGARPDLTQAKVVVSGGRPLKDAATFESVIGGLADALGGAVGATRAAVDSGIAPNELQVGQTGKIVAPDLYIAAGISGSTQHMAGIKDSRVIVAINRDPDAPIFEFADFGLVADLFEAIPEIRKRLGK